jgi:hypothetical protein
MRHDPELSEALRGAVAESIERPSELTAPQR